MISVNEIREIDELLANWRAERMISKESQNEGFYYNILEEMLEYGRAKNDNERIDALCDIIVFAINANCYSDQWDLLSTISNSEPFPTSIVYNLARYEHLKYFSVTKDHHLKHRYLETIILICAEEMRNLGYNPYKCLVETIKEISSRTGEWDEEIGKWVKDTSPEAKAKWYKADYDSAILE